MNEIKLSHAAIEAIEMVLMSGDSVNIVVEDGMIAVYAIEATPIVIED